MFRISRVIFANYRKIKCINNQVTFTPCDQRTKNLNFTQIAIAASLFSFFQKKDENEESELIMTIKRGILCIQREEHQKAEKMFHLALRLAQTVQDNAAITYIYDCMANLAYELGDLEKAEKIFVSVCQRLMQYDGAKEDDIRMLHISTKIAHMAYLRNNFEKSLQGLEYALTKIESQKNFMENDELLELWGLVKNFLGQTLIQMGRHEEAIKALTEAFEIFKKFREEASEDGMILLNNLSCACSELKQYEQAELYLKQAIEIAKAIKIEDISPYKINLGLLYFKQGLLDKTKDMCKTAWHIAKKHDNKDALNGADDCLEQLKKVLL